MSVPTATACPHQFSCQPWVVQTPRPRTEASHINVVPEMPLLKETRYVSGLLFSVPHMLISTLHQPGLFKSVFSRIMSPFRRGDDPLASPEKIAKRLTGEPSINDGDVFGDVEGKIDVVVHREHQAGPSKARIDAQVRRRLVFGLQERYLIYVLALDKSATTHRSHPVSPVLTRTNFTNYLHPPPLQLPRTKSSPWRRRSSDPGRRSRCEGAIA